MEREEQPLAGGRVTPGVVRVGDTVRRPRGANARRVHALLRHLEAVGFAGAPRLRGIDERGREVLTWIQGEVPPDLQWFGPAALREAARLLAHLHAATAGTPLAEGAEVVCHGDASPCNAVFREGLPVAWIDFDACVPGPRRLDVGYAAWTWLDLGNPEQDARQCGRRLGLFVDAYGEGAPRDPVDAVLDAQSRLAERCAAGPGDPAFLGPIRAWALRCRDWVRAHRGELEAGFREGREAPREGGAAGRGDAGGPAAPRRW